MKRIGIFGTSGMAREAGDIVLELGYEPVYVANNEGDVRNPYHGGIVINESDLFEVKVDGYVIGVGDNKIRQEIAQKYKNKIKFVSIIHPSASFGYKVKNMVMDGCGLIISAGVRLTNGIEIGDFTILNLNTTISHDVRVDQFAHLSPGVNVCGNVHIEEKVWIGGGAVIKNGASSQKIKIGRNTIIGLGSVVLQDCEPESIYAGVPARKIK